MTTRKTSSSFEYGKIYKNVPLPNVRNAINPLLTEMKVGDVVYFPTDEFCPSNWYSRAAKANMRIAVRKIDETTMGMWRVD
jgi:hypothetical protein